MKTVFLEKEMPTLIELGGQLADYHMQKKKKKKDDDNKGSGTYYLLTPPSSCQQTATKLKTISQSQWLTD